MAMEFIFRLVRKVTDMENPKNNQEESKKYYVEKGETFEDDKANGHIFKLLDGNVNQVRLEYDRHYLVKDEHKAYEYTTTLELNQTKKITSMWGKEHIAITITYLGVEGEVDLKDKAEEKYTPEDKKVEPPVMESLDKFENKSDSKDDSLNTQHKLSELR